MRRTIIVPFGVLYSQKFSYLCPILYICDMRTKIISLALLSVVWFAPTITAKPVVTNNEPKAKIEELIEAGEGFFGAVRNKLMTPLK